jgi:epoxyqueuosine reductase
MPAMRERPEWPGWQADLARRLQREGASKVGFADLSGLPVEIRAGLPRAVSVAVALDPAIVAQLTSGPTVAYHAEYDRVNARLSRLAEHAVDFLEGHGHVARTSAVTVKVVDGDGATALPHKTVATRAGLGWIGDCALLITPDFGAAIRLATVLTDAPLVCDEPIDESRCGTCRACVEACPAGAVTGEVWHAGIARQEILDVDACKRTASSLATAQGIDVIICGVCVNACPWTRKYLRTAGTPRG